MDDTFKFKCSICGKEFDPDPDTVSEVGFSAVPSNSIEEAQQLLDDGDAFTDEQLRDMNEYELKEIGLTPQSRDELLENMYVETGADIVCAECQIRIAEQGE